MRITIILLAIVLSTNAFAQKNSYDLVINNVNVIDQNSNKILPAQNVYVKNGVVEITNKMIKIPVPKQQIDGTGKYLMTALWDMHVHFPQDDAARFFNLQTAAGITNCRIMKSEASTIAFSKTANQSPTMKICYNFNGEEKYNVDSVTTIINSLKKKGYDFIKCFGVRDEAFFDAMMKAAKANNIIVCGHALSNIKPKKVLASGYKSIEHVGYFDKLKSAEILDSMIQLAKANNVYICPTLDWSMQVYHSIPLDSMQYRAGYAIGTKLYKVAWDTTYENMNQQLKGNEKKYADFMRNGVEQKIAILTKLRAAGVKIIAGSDAEEPYQTPGFSLIDELRLIQKAGFTNAELLQMVTTNANAFFGITTKKNEYILLEKNPLENIGNLESVQCVIKGKEIIDCKKLLETIK